MRKKIIGLLTTLVLTASMLSGCGASMNKTSESAGTYATAAKSENMYVVPVSDQKALEASGEAKQSASDTKVDSGNGEVSLSFSEAVTGAGSVPNPILDQRKVIRSANITVEVDNFDNSYGRINSAILGIGFIQETNINTERVYVDGVQKLVKRGTIVLRVDRNKFDKVLNGLKEIGAVMNWSIQGEDVTEKYFDTESRLKLLRLEEERVLGYLKKIDNPDKVVAYETRLTNIRHEIESLTGTIRKLSDLVDLSTITINMNEKYPGSDKPVKEKTYWDRMSEKFTASMKGVIEFCGNFIIFVIAALPVLVLMGLCAWLIIFIYRRISKLAKTKNSPKNDKVNKGDNNDNGEL